MFCVKLNSKQRLLLPATAALLLGLAGCETTPPKPADTRAADETAIRGIEAAMIKAVSTCDAAGAISPYVDDVVAMSPDSPTLHGKDAMRQYFDKMCKETPEFTATTTKVEVARAGDFAYSLGTGTMTIKPKKGKPVATGFKYITEWKKQPDASWKIIVDTMIPDPPSKAASPAKRPAHKAEHKAHRKSHT